MIAYFIILGIFTFISLVASIIAIAEDIKVRKHEKRIGLKHPWNINKNS